ncbi:MULTISPECIES: putative lipoprotein [Methylococcus]|uniref:Lipoprotein n=2 Tax=Methylococcus capsulatus TaxID=414 RepID=A0ABZ2F7J6_METCP|nr:putative lipoprotein [Methylococcus sp. BF19-07]
MPLKTKILRVPVINVKQHGALRRTTLPPAGTGGAEETIMASRRFHLPGLAALLVGLALQGCSFSYSSESSVKTSASPFTSSASISESSSSSSKSSQNKKARYEKSVAEYTTEFAKSGSSDSVAFYARVSQLAQEYGITGWDGDKDTYVAIGKGLAGARLGQPQYEALRRLLANADPTRMQYIDEGYR